jgi:two-component system chemotaxis response regulator CheB
MQRVRVLIVDDSVTVRRMLSDILAADPDIEVVGTAPNAAIALTKLAELSPDVVTLDVEMPEVSGLDLLVDIRKRSPRLPVIMFSSLTQRAASTTLDALARGATDYVTKPTGAGSREAASEQIRTQLLPKIKGLARPTPATKLVAARPAPRPGPSAADRIDVVAVGTSTGGPNALSAVFPDIPATLPAAVLIVQHMPPLFTQLLAERLDRKCPLEFREARDGDLVVPGVALIAPGDHHMQVARAGTDTVVVLDKGPPENSCRPAVDVLFRSIAATYGGRALAVVLTGMGQDGLRGCERIQAEGGQIVVQDEATSVVWGMPGYVANAGLASKVLALEDVAAEIVRRVGAEPQRPAREGSRNAG